MAQTKENWTVGEAVRKSSLQRMSDAAGTADDRALEILATPGSTLKKILPLSEESATLNPRILVAGKDTDATIANGVVRVRPAHFIAGASANAIGLSAKLAANLDSPVFGNNSSGVTRYDLLYASISYGTATAESVRQKPLSGGDPISVNINTQFAPLVTLNVVAGVASGNPLASLPADAGGVYNFGLAKVAIANAFAGGAINQASITPLWEGGWIASQRFFDNFLFGLYSSSDGAKPSTPFSSRWGGVHRGILVLKVTTGMPLVGVSWEPLDGASSAGGIDWRNRLLRLAGGACLGDAGTALEAQTGGIGDRAGISALSGNANDFGWTGTGTDSSESLRLFYNGGTNELRISVSSTDGTLQAARNTGPQHGGGDLIAMILEWSDRILTVPF